MLSASALSNVFDLNDSGQLSLDMNCDSSSAGGRMVLVDNDGNNVASSGDIVELDYNYCRQDSLVDFVTGRVDVEIVSMSIGDDLSVTGQFTIAIPGDLTFDSGNSVLVDVSGRFRAAFTATGTIKNLDISTHGTDALQIVTRDGTESSTEVADQITISRKIRGSSYTITAMFDVHSESAGGEFDCVVAQDLTGTLAQFPDIGTLACTGLNGSSARVVATSSDRIVTQVDAVGDGTFVDAGIIRNGNGVWGDYVDGGLFVELVDGPHNSNRSVIIPSVSSTTLATAAGDTVVDAAHDETNSLIYLANNEGLEVVDLESMSISDSLPIADRPVAVDVSDDGSVLWIGLGDTSEVVSIETATLTERDRIDIGVDPQSGLPRIASDIQIAPGSTDTVVIATRESREVIAFADGTQLPNTVDDFDAPTVIEFDGANTILGVHDATTLFSASLMSFDENGVTLVKALRDYSDGFSNHITISDSVVWVAAGRAVDIVNELVLGRANFNQFSGFGRRSAPHIDSDANTAWFYNTRGSVIEFFDIQTFTGLGAYRLAASDSGSAWLFGIDADDLLLVLDNEIHLIDKSLLAQTVNGPTCSTIDLGGQLGPTVFIQIQCPFNDMVYDEDRGLIYASIGSIAGANGNSIVVIDPQTGTVQSYINAGSEPRRLAMSGGRTRLYVTLDEANFVAVVDLQSQQLVSTVRLDDDPVFPSPGVARVIAASSQTELDFVAKTEPDISAYINGIKATNTYAGTFGVTDIFYNSTGSRVYAVGNTDTLWTFDIDATGLTNAVETRGLLHWVGAKMEDDLIYDREGSIVNPSIPAVTATCPAILASAVEPDPATDDVYYMNTETESNIQVCDSNSLAITKTFTVPSFDRGYFLPKLAKSGVDRIAIKNENKIVLLDPTEF